MQDPITPSPETPAYPVGISMVYPERLSRLSTLFQIILAIPVLIFLGLLTGGYGDWGQAGSGARNLTIGASTSILLAMWAAIIVRGRIPHWLFDFQVALHRFSYRTAAYVALLTDRYPAFEGDWDLQYDVEYPDRLTRWKVFLWKVISAIPHFIVLFFLTIAAAFVVFIGWWAVLFTGRFPQGLHRFVVGVMRWSARVSAYVESLTDAYPPFSLDEDAGPGSSGTELVSAIIGGAVTVLMIGAVATGAALLYRYFTDTKSVQVNYQQALSGNLSGATREQTFDKVTFSLDEGDDSYSSQFLSPPEGSRIVAMTVGYYNSKALRSGSDVELDSLRLKTNTRTYAARVLTVEGAPAPLDVPHGQELVMKAYFQIDDDASVEELQAYPDADVDRHVVWEFER